MLMCSLSTGNAELLFYILMLMCSLSTGNAELLLYILMLMCSLSTGNAGGRLDCCTIKWSQHNSGVTIRYLQQCWGSGSPDPYNFP